MEKPSKTNKRRRGVTGVSFANVFSCKLTATVLVCVYADVVGIVVVEAGGTVVFTFAGAVLHAFHAEVAETFHAQHLRNFCGAHGTCRKFALARKVHAKKAGVGDRGRCYADVDFQGACVAQHLGENL